VTPQEAVWFNLDWKVPCVLHYTAIPAPEPTAYVSPLTYDVFGEDKCIARSGGTRGITFTPLASDEMPKKGTFHVSFSAILAQPVLLNFSRWIILHILELFL